MKEQWVICHYLSHEIKLYGMFDSEKNAIEYAVGICAVGALGGTYSVHKVLDVAVLAGDGIDVANKIDKLMESK